MPVSVQLSLQGGWAGDMYVSLLHGSGFAVLLNRPGRDLVNSDGSGVEDFFVDFDDNAPTDIHTDISNSGVFFGSYQPDAREIDPDFVLDTSSRTAFLSTFDDLNANGDWTLFVADVSSGGQMILDSWSLNIQGVPEPITALITALSLLSLLRRRRQNT